MIGTQITTAEQLNALPVGTVLLIEEGDGATTTAQRAGDGHAQRMGDPWLYRWRETPLPATVLHVPAAQEPPTGAPEPQGEEKGTPIDRAAAAGAQARRGATAEANDTDRAVARAVFASIDTNKISTVIREYECENHLMIPFEHVYELAGTIKDHLLGESA